jgi:hypothetical protein
MKYDVFISYSREDSDIIDPVVQFVRALRNSPVFRDIDNIIAGKKWEPQLMEALTDASLVIVFWCEHSATSSYVQKEYKFAIEHDKDILPVLLDKTKMPKDLSAFQAIDLSNTIMHGLELKSRFGDDDSVWEGFSPYSGETLLISDAIKNALHERLSSPDNT